MNWEEQIIDYLTGELPQDQRIKVEQAIKDDPSVAKIYEDLEMVYGNLGDLEVDAPAEMTMDFEQFLQKEIQASNNESSKTAGKGSNKWIMPVVMLLLGSMAIAAYLYEGVQTRSYDQHFASQVDLKPFDSDSPSQRIQAIAQRVNRLNEGNNENTINYVAVTAIITRMLEDDNSNVRLAAAEALSQHSEIASVTDAYLYVLENETDEMVLITVIDALAKTNQEKNIDKINNIIKQPEASQAVKEGAEMALFKLDL